MGVSSTAATTEGTPGRRPLTHRVFVSSTSVDLPRYRERVRDVLLRLGLFPVAMEYFGARGSGDATSVSVGGVDTCDVYLGLVAWRYGHVPAGATRSVTEQEYDEAKRLGLPCYIFLADPATEADEVLFPAALRNAERHAELEAFRARLERENLREYFTTPDDLATKVATALAGYVVRLREEELASGPRPPRELPPRPPEFVGREAELGKLEAALRRGQSVGLSAAVSGLAGVGKSALAAELLYRLAAQDPPPFPGGLAWVRCDGRTGLEGLAWVLDQLLAAWGVTLAPEQLARAGDDPEAGVALRVRALRARVLPTEPGRAAASALVLLDNVEYRFPLDRALEALAPLGITLLTTSRHQPGAPGLQLLPLDVLDHEAAARLFAERYAERGGAWDAARDAVAADAVVEALGRLPLGIELAAARAARQRAGVEALAAELGEAGRLGRLGDPGDPSRSVRYAFAQTLALLTPAQRVRFAALGLPDGPDWPRPTIEALLAAVPPDAPDAGPASDDLDLLASLSLVALLPPETPGVPAPRARLHPLLRKLAAEEWAHQPEATRRVGLAALLAAVGTIADEYGDDFTTLSREEQLIVGTLRRAAHDHVDLEALAATVAALGDYLRLAGRWQLGMEVLGWQLEARRAVGDRAGEGRTLNNLGSLAADLGRPEEAARYYEQALAIRREVGDRAGEGATLGNLGALAYGQGRAEEAARYSEQALAVLREVGDRATEGAALHNLGAMAARQGRPEEATRYFEQALAIFREVGDRLGEGGTLLSLGALAADLGRPEEAARYYEQALAIRREVGDRAGEGVTLNGLGLLARSQDRMEEAARYYEQALAIAREVGDRTNEGVALGNLGALADAQGWAAEAARRYEQALAILREVGDRAREGTILINLGTLAITEGRTEEAARYYEKALAVAREVGDRAGEGVALGSLGAVAYDEGRAEEAARRYEQALAILREVGDRADEAAMLKNLGELADAQGRREEAARCFEQALAIFEAIGAADSARKVRKNLAALRASRPPAAASDAAPGRQDSAPMPEPVLPPAPASAKRRRWWPFGR